MSQHPALPAWRTSRAVIGKAIVEVQVAEDLLRQAGADATCVRECLRLQVALAAALTVLAQHVSPVRPAWRVGGEVDLNDTPTKEECVEEFWRSMNGVIADAILAGWNPRADLEYLSRLAPER